MKYHLRAHFDGRVLVPDGPVNLPLNQTFEIDVSTIGTNGEKPANSEVIAERLRKLEGVRTLIPGPVIPLEALRRASLYDDRA